MSAPRALASASLLALLAPASAVAQPRPAAPRAPSNGVGAPANPGGAQASAGDAQANPGGAQTNTASPAPNAPNAAAPASSAPPDLTIDIRAPAPNAPARSDDDDDDDDEPAPRAAPPQGAVPLQYPYGYPYAWYPAPVQPPRPVVVDRPRDVAHAWSRHLALGVSAGIGSPLGYIGGWADVNVSRWIGFTVGAGLGGSFGPAVALGANFRPFAWGRWAPYVGLGFSTNFTPGDVRASYSIRAPVASWWFNPELGMEFRARNGVFLRFAAGYTVMLNTGAFTNRDFRGYYGEPYHSVVGFDPVSAADAHDNGVALSFLFTHIDLGGLLNL